MTTIATQLAVIEIAVQSFRERAPDAAPPIIAAPITWMRGVAAELEQPEGMVPQSIHGCSVVQKDDLDEPVIVTHDGKAYKVSKLLEAGPQRA